MRPRLVLVGFLVLLIGGVGQAQIAPRGKAFLFRLKLAKGRTLEFTQTTTVVTKAMPKQTLTGPFRMSALDVKGRLTTLRIVVGPMSLAGRTVTAKQVATLTVNDRGETVSGAAAEIQTFGASLPESPVKVGDRWSESTNLPVASGPATTVETTYEFLGVRTEGPRRVALLGVVLRGRGGIQLNGKGTVRLDCADGTLLKYEVVSNLNLGPGSGPEVRATSTTVVARKP
ncbi:MAG: hypothetical protein KIS66_08595 [Fimbriimonadaceae bacterium]|nr:hypothetical protein [Fimbriimonadaceae bacterium]